MENFNIHLNLTQDVGHGVTVIFVCCVLVVAATLIDLWTGVEAARKQNEKISSRALRRTVNKTLDYLRVVMFAVLIDVLGLCLPWYELPYCAVLSTLGVLAIEGKSVLENFQKKHSPAADVVDVAADMAEEIIGCKDVHDARKIIKKVKNESKQ